MILWSARAAHWRGTCSFIISPRSLWCHSAKSAGHRSHMCSAVSTSSPLNRQTASTEMPSKCCLRRWAGWREERKRAMLVRSVMARDVSICSPSRDVHTSYCRSCWMGGRQEQRMWALRVAVSRAVSFGDSAAPSFAWWSANSLTDRSQWPGDLTIRINFDFASTAADACSLMTDESAELALLTDWTSDLQSLMIIAEAHDEMDDGHWMASSSEAFSAWKDLIWVDFVACHTWTWSPWLSTNKPAPPSSIPSWTKPSAKSAREMEARVWIESSLCWDWDIVFATGVMTVGIGEACTMEELKAAHWGIEQELNLGIETESI